MLTKSWLFNKTTKTKKQKEGEKMSAELIQETLNSVQHKPVAGSRIVTGILDRIRSSRNRILDWDKDWEKEWDKTSEPGWNESWDKGWTQSQ